MGNPGSLQEIDELVAAAKEPLNAEDQSMLDAYTKLGQGDRAWS